MVQPGSLDPAQEAARRLQVEKQERQQVPRVVYDQDKGKSKFKAILESKNKPDETKRTSSKKVSDDDEEESSSIFQIAASKAQKANSRPETSELLAHADDTDIPSDEDGDHAKDASSKDKVSITQDPKSKILSAEEVEAQNAKSKVKPYEETKSRDTKGNDSKGDKETQSQLSFASHLTQPNAISNVAAQERIVPPKVREDILKVIEQMTAILETQKLQDRTNITITLKQPPIFEGATLIITEFKQAQKEFNLTFVNLNSPEARALIELKQNQDLLRNSLVERGYNLQKVTVEQKIEGLVASQETEKSRGERDSEGNEDDEDKRFS